LLNAPGMQKLLPPFLRGALFFLLAGAGFAAAAVAGCGDGSAMGAAGGAGGTGGAAPSCTFYGDAGLEGSWPITTDEYTLCRGLANRDSWCSPQCATEPPDQCASEWACLRLSLRPEMVADLYACMPTVPCSEGDPFGACTAKLAKKYPPSAGLERFEAAQAVCATPSPCTDTGCGVYGDGVYDSMALCYDLTRYPCSPDEDPSLCQLGQCLAATLCNLLGPTLSVLETCLAYLPADAGPTSQADGGDGGGF
jgi:hypothetical protein